MKMKVLDTNVFLDKTIEGIFESFTEPTTVIIPHVVLKELDTFKDGFETRHEYSRAATRFLDKLRADGPLHEGVKFGEHEVVVDIDISQLDLTKPDYEIIFAAFKSGAELVTRDLNERVIADALGIQASGFEPDNVDVNNLYTGYTTIELNDGEIQAWQLGEYQDKAYLNHGNKSFLNTRHELLNNQFVIMKAGNGGEFEGIYKASSSRIHSLKNNYKAFGIKPKNREQRFLFHALLDPEIEVVTAIGPSGTGKTLLTFAAAMQQTLNTPTYSRTMAMRPLVAVGEDIGFLPGDKLEKLAPWMASTFDALEYLLQDYDLKDHDINPGQGSKEKMMSLIESGYLELEAMAHIRGRSIPDQFMVIDDAQNLTRQEGVTIVTRVGEGTKLVLLGDLNEKQIDNKRLTPNSNGLAYIVDRFKGTDITAHITLQTVVRSRVAQLGVDLL